jgi:sec-independent protein translocase protein TatA
MGGISVWQLLIILAIVLVLFGAKRIKNLGADLGGAVKGFKQAVKEGGDEDKSSDSKLEEHKEGRVIDGEVTRKEQDKV